MGKRKTPRIPGVPTATKSPAVSAEVNISFDIDQFEREVERVVMSSTLERLALANKAIMERGENIVGNLPSPIGSPPVPAGEQLVTVPVYTSDKPLQTWNDPTVYPKAPLRFLTDPFSGEELEDIYPIRKAPPVRNRLKELLQIDPKPNAPAQTPTQAREAIQKDLRRYMDMVVWSDKTINSFGPYLTDPIEPQPYKGKQRVQMDVRLAEKKIEEAMSLEAKAFKHALLHHLEKSMLKSLEATAGFKMLAEDWEVLRQSLIDIVNEQARLYFRQNQDYENNRYDATITFEIPKMTLSFRMPVDRLDEF